MDEQAAQSEADSGGASTKRRRGRLVLFAFVAALVVYAIPFALTANPRACASCHKMRPYYESWRTSSHSRAASNCLYCHVRPGALSLVLYRVMFYREIAAQLLGADLKPWGTTIPGVHSCSRAGCHSLNRLTSTSGLLRIGHRVHVVKAGIACIRCHPGAAHKGVGGRRLLPPRKLCAQCHASKMQDCSYCHIGRVSDARGAH